MNVIRKILYVLVSVLALFCVFIVVCAFRPDITDKVKTMLYRDHDLVGTADSESDPLGDLAAEDIVYVPQSEDQGAQDNDAGADTRKENTGNSRQTENSSQTGDRARTDSAAKDNTLSAGLKSDNTTDYIAPDEAEIVVPDNVSGRSGYQQVEGEAQQIDDAAADDIQNQLDFGYTGDGLVFDPVFYPYYDMLDDTGKHVYRQIYANADAINQAFMPVENVTSAQLRNIFAAVYNDHPELFWLETAYSCKFTRSGQCVEIDLKFNKTAQELDNAKSDFNEQVNSIIAGAQVFSDNYSREKYVHDQLLEKVSYNSRAEMNQSAYSALVNGQTVCAGYARAFQYILQQLGIPCYYCTGFAGESHAWNIVELSDGFYNVDTTWDDSDGGKYDYFNKSDEDYSSSHLRKELSVYLPPCNGQAYRNLEQSGGAGENNPVNGPRSLADVGISENQVITDMNKYYEDCYNQIVQNGVGEYTFYNVVSGAPLCNQVGLAYNTSAYWQFYMENAMNAVGASNCDWVIEWEELQGDMYLISHEIKMRQ